METYNRPMILLLENGAFWNSPHKADEYLDYMDSDKLSNMRAGDFMNWAVKRGFPGNT